MEEEEAEEEEEGGGAKNGERSFDDKVEREGKVQSRSLPCFLLPFLLAGESNFPSYLFSFQPSAFE